MLFNMNEPMEREFAHFKRLSGFYLSRVVNEPLQQPDSVQMNLTFRCNLRCRMCSISGSDAPEARYRNYYKWGISLDTPSKLHDAELTTEEIKRVVDEMVQMKIPILIMMGGEPFVRDDILEVTNYAEDRGRTTVIVTNGTMIDRDLAIEIVKSKMSHLQFSLDGATAKTHDLIRGIGSFKRLVDNIITVNEVKNTIQRTVKLRKLSAAATYTIMNQNCHELLDVMYLAEEIGLNGINFQPVMTLNNNPFNFNPHTPQWVQESRLPILDKALDGLMEYKRQSESKERQGAVDVTSTYAQLRLMKKYFRGVNVAKAKESKCYAGFNRILPTQISDVYLCGSNAVGDLKTQSLQDIWYSDIARKARRKIKNCQNHCLNFCSYITNQESMMLTLTQTAQDFLDVTSPETNGFSMDQKMAGVQMALEYLQDYQPIIAGYLRKHEEDTEEITETLQEMEDLKEVLRERLQILEGKPGHGSFHNTSATLRRYVATLKHSLLSG